MEQTPAPSVAAIYAPELIIAIQQQHIKTLRRFSYLMFTLCVGLGTWVYILLHHGSR